MKKTIFIITTFIFVLSSCKSNGSKPIPLKEFDFNSIFGAQRNQPKNAYCLLGTGFFRAPRSTDSDSLIDQWIKSHPNASVIPVSSSSPILTQEPESKMIYCWIVDGNDTINNFLIRKGCFPGGTMTRPKTWDEMEEWEKELYATDEKADIEVFIDRTTYNKFIEQIKEAEIYARNNKLGIWAREDTDE